MAKATRAACLGGKDDEGYLEYNLSKAPLTHLAHDPIADAAVTVPAHADSSVQPNNGDDTKGGGARSKDGKGDKGGMSGKDDEGYLEYKPSKNPPTHLAHDYGVIYITEAAKQD